MEQSANKIITMQTAALCWIKDTDYVVSQYGLYPFTTLASSIPDVFFSRSKQYNYTERSNAMTLQITSYTLWIT